MRSFFAATLFVIISVNTNGQSEKDIFQYLNIYQSPVSNKKDAVYYRVVEEYALGFLVTDYYVSNDSVAMRAVCTKVSPNLEKNGECIWYYDNGVKKEEGYFKDSKRIGVFNTYHDNGSLNSEIDYRNGTGTPDYKQFWTREGQPLLENGTGFVEARYSFTEYNPTYKEFKDYSLVGSYAIDPAQGDTTYVVVETPAEYADHGMAGFYDGIGKGLLGKYPKKARQTGIQGRVFVEFTVDKSGAMRDTRVIKGIGGGCDELALGVVSKLGKWNPARHHGKPVNSKMVVPIIFRIN